MSDVVIPSDYLQKDFKPSYCKKCPLTTYVMTNTNEKIRCPFFAYLIDKDCNNKACPLVELPPHGRLIDADVMLEATRFWSFGRSDDYFDLKIKNTIIKAFLDTAPTVLEAREVVE